jgi:hypothetical protein
MPSRVREGTCDDAAMQWGMRRCLVDSIRMKAEERAAVPR